MRNANILAVLLMLAVTALWLPSSKATVFEPTDGDVNFLGVSAFFSSDGEAATPSFILGLFDEADSDFSGPWLNVPLPGLVQFSGPDAGGDWTASSGPDSITLPDSSRFILAISEDGGSSWMGDQYVAPMGANTYFVSFSDPSSGLGPGLLKSVVMVDARVVPIPAAAWLFGSGLVGLVAVARRKGRFVR